MTVERTEIISSKDSSDSQPWFEFDINENARGTLVISVTEDNDAEGPDISGVQADLSGNYDLNKPWTVAHTQNGLEVYDRSDGDTPDGLLSNLAYWHPDIDTFEVLKFAEE